MSCMRRMTLIVSGTVSGWRSEAQRTSASGEGSMPMRSLALTTPITFSSVPSQTGKLLCGMSCTRFMFSSKLRRELSQAISLLGVMMVLMLRSASVSTPSTIWRSSRPKLS